MTAPRKLSEPTTLQTRRRRRSNRKPKEGSSKIMMMMTVTTVTLATRIVMTTNRSFTPLKKTRAMPTQRKET